MNCPPAIRAVFLLLPMGLVWGCLGPPVTPVPEASRQPSTLRLVPGNQIELKFIGAPELNVVQPVSRDGLIQLPLLGSYAAAGKTPAEVHDELSTHYADQLQRNELSLVVRTPAPAYVVGSVLQPGPVPLDRPLTVFDAITAAGGFNQEEAEVRSVVVSRREDHKRNTYVLNFKETLLGKKDGQQVFYLEPYDVVFVPRTRISKVNQAVEQYINRMLPRLGLRYDSDGVYGVYR